MAQDGGVDPHSISAAYGFLDRCRSRPASSCILEVPARFERAITDLQSVALPAWLWNHVAPSRGFEPLPTGSKPIVLPLHQPGMVREVRFELTCLAAPGFESGTYTSSVTRAWCLPRDSNPQSSRHPGLNRTCIPIPTRRHGGDPCGT